MIYEHLTYYPNKLENNTIKYHPLIIAVDEEMDEFEISIYECLYSYEQGTNNKIFFLFLSVAILELIYANSFPDSLGYILLLIFFEFYITLKYISLNEKIDEDDFLNNYINKAEPVYQRSYKVLTNNSWSNSDNEDEKMLKKVGILLIPKDDLGLIKLIEDKIYYPKMEWMERAVYSPEVDFSTGYNLFVGITKNDGITLLIPQQYCNKELGVPASVLQGVVGSIRRDVAFVFPELFLEMDNPIKIDDGRWLVKWDGY